MLLSYVVKKPVKTDLVTPFSEVPAPVFPEMGKLLVYGSVDPEWGFHVFESCPESHFPSVAVTLEGIPFCFRRR